uniref:Un-named sa1614 n=1 Tax=Scophthalmus maximus TaxID=52904 RepID=A0A8D3CYQ1_SCOMX
MPECVSVSEFVQEVQEDWSSPTTSSFTAKMINCRNTVYLLEEVSAEGGRWYHVCHLEQYIHSMEKLSLNCHSNGETEVGSAFCRLADFSKELVSPMKNLVSERHACDVENASNEKPVISVGSSGPQKKSPNLKTFLWNWIEKEKRELARQYGMVRTEVSGGEIAEELEKERRSFQLSMCEYLIKVNEIKTKRGVDLLQNLIKHYHSHNKYDHTHTHTHTRTHVKQRNEDEKRQLCSLRDQLRPAVPTEQQDSLPKQVYSMHQLLGDKQYGTERSGFLYKKSDGLRKMWQKRKCSVHNCYLTIAHATPNKPPTRLNLLTCQVKPSVEDKKCFDLISHNRTYHFLAEDEAECVAWISVLSNSKQEALSVALDGGRRGAGGGESSVEDLTRTITDDIRRMPGNTNCCDCGAPDPGWLSTNLGILTCIECSGIHREMGVHVSRIHSLNLDSLGTSDLLLARNVGNSGFNEILEANLLSPSLKPSQHSHMAERKDFILLKYQDVHFVRRSHSSNAALRLGLQEATKSCDIYSLIQLHCTLTLFPYQQEKGETAIHLAVLLADRTSLHILDFLAQNCSNVDMQTTAGNTALHYSCLHNKSDCVKLLLRARANTHIKNELGETALDVSRKLKHSHCEALLQQAQSNQFDHHVHVEYEWRLRHDDLYDSDDDFDDKVTTATERLLVYLLYSFSVQEQNRVVLTNGPVKKERTSSSSSSFTSSFSFTSRPFSFSQSVAPPSSAAPGAPGGGLLSVGRRLAMAMDLHSRTSGTAPSPPPPPPSSPAPPLPPRVKGQFTSIDYQSQITSRPQLTCVQIHLQHHLLDVHQPRGAASRRVQALYDCQADHHDELSFTEGQVLVVLGQDDCDWWHGYIEDEPDQRGLFPSSFVQLFSD